MSKFEMLQQDMIAAMKNKEVIERDVLRLAIAACKKYAIDNKCKDNMTDELVDKVLLKEKKIIEEQISTCPDKYVDVKQLFKTQIKILNKYVPQLLDEPEEIREIVRQATAAAGIELVKANKGAVMKTIMPILKGKADMKVVNQVVTEELQ